MISNIVVCATSKGSDEPVHTRSLIRVSKGAKIRNRYNQIPHLTQDTNGKVTNSQLDTKNQSQEVSPFPAGNHKAHINRCAQRHSKHKTKKNIKGPQKKFCLGTVSKILVDQDTYIFGLHERSLTYQYIIS